MNGVDPIAGLRAATCSDGAPSARNLLVTVFGDALLPYGPATTASVKSLSALLASFGVNERLVRTSLTRLANDDLLVAHSAGRRSFYGVAPDALELFRRADDRIYRGSAGPWDGAWTIVVIDGNEATARDRQRLRQELGWAGFGIVAPNVMASPTSSPETAADAVSHVGGFDRVLITRSTVFEGAGSTSAADLARRTAPLDDAAERYRAFIDQFEPVGAGTALALEPDMAFKLRTMLVASFRRIVLADPLLPAPLLSDDWVGTRARGVAASLYGALADASERFLREHVEPALPDRDHRAPRFV